MSVDTAALGRIVEDVWATMLGMDVVADHGVEPLHLPLTALVHISGDWDGAVQLELPPALARRATGAMLGLAEDDACPDDVRDAIGELANMVGGNYKSLLHGHCALSLPVVADGDAYRLTVPGGAVVERRSFRCGADRFSASIVHRVRASEESA